MTTQHPAGSGNATAAAPPHIAIPAGPVLKEEAKSIMPASTTRLTYYNRIMWHMVLLPDGTRAVWPSRLDGQPLPGAATRYYRGPGRTSRAGNRQPVLAAAPG